MFIKLKEISNERTIDVRTKEEFEKMPLLQYNVPIIDKDEHQRIKRMYPLAFIIIYLGLRKRKGEVKKALLEISENGKHKVVIGCSRGRLRSPYIYFYAKSMGIKCEILSGGIKKHFEGPPTGLIDRIYSYFDLE
ncbi:hypothetical protein [uncultured Clostridium sp.]|uniref:hypothetical protein n=1 Tax=uncultured Clostridium sp. TaxID=59620 RepID=UPI00262688B7|nr:hypothetical protein [uncultured Clostridium sp.]